MNVEDLICRMAENTSKMTPDERTEAVLSLYTMDLIDRRKARELLGIDEMAYIERALFGSWLPCLEKRFDSLSDEFLSSKVVEQLKEYGEQ